MLRVPIMPFSDAGLREAVDTIRRGGVVAHATETCYGFACDLTNPDALERLFAIKNRPRSQPVSGLFASLAAAKEQVLWTDEAERYAVHLPGPLTIILPLAADSPILPCPEGGSTLGVRVSSHPHARHLAEAAGIPLSTTSANLHGYPNPYSTEDILNQFAFADYEPDLILDGGTLPPVAPSTVIDLTGDRKLKRQGEMRVIE